MTTHETRQHAHSGPVWEPDPAATGIFDSFTAENEGVYAAVAGDGLVREDGDDRREAGVRTALVATDRRALFVPESGGADVGSLAYDSLAGVTLDDGALALHTADGVTWRFPLAGGADAEPVPHLRWVGRLRRRVLAARNDADLRAGALREADPHDPATAVDGYRQLREELDRLFDALARAPLDAAALAPELTDVERRLEAERARLDVRRARSRATLARQLAGTGDLDRAATALAEAEEFAATARGRRAAVDRPDAFRFGEQRALDEALSDLEWALAAAAAEPLRRAEEARLRARSAESPAPERWAAALQRYDSLRDAPGAFDADPEAVERGRNGAAEGLVAARAECARRAWNAAVDRDDAGLDRRRTALEQLDRALAVAADHDGPVGALAARRDRLVGELRRGRTAHLAAARLDRVEDGADSAPPTAADLEALDVHHEISDDLDGGDGAEAGAADPARPATADPVGR